LRTEALEGQAGVQVGQAGAAAGATLTGCRSVERPPPVARPAPRTTLISPSMIRETVRLTTDAMRVRNQLEREVGCYADDS
jgi:hypothetical protein